MLLREDPPSLTDGSFQVDCWLGQVYWGKVVQQVQWGFTPLKGPDASL